MNKRKLKKSSFDKINPVFKIFSEITKKYPNKKNLKKPENKKIILKRKKKYFDINAKGAIIKNFYLNKKEDTYLRFFKEKTYLYHRFFIKNKKKKKIKIIM